MFDGHTEEKAQKQVHESTGLGVRHKMDWQIALEMKVFIDGAAKLFIQKEKLKLDWIPTPHHSVFRSFFFFFFPLDRISL